MDSKTRDRLNRLNRAFYRAVAEDFSATREQPWRGWRRVLESVQRRCESSRASRPLRVIDFGCGNGRFASFLAGECGSPFRYLGIDSNRALLAIARRRCRDIPHIGFACGDVLECLGQAPRTAEVGAGPHRYAGSNLPAAGFDLAALFGLLHHLPGFETRRLLVRKLASHLAPGGLLALAAWRFGALERFQSRILDWRDYNRTATDPLDLTQLEPRDYLLGWGGRNTHLRYCHFVDEAEMKNLLEGLGLEPIDEFTDDGSSGDLNHYVVLRRAHGRR